MTWFLGFGDLALLAASAYIGWRWHLAKDRIAELESAHATVSRLLSYATGRASTAEAELLRCQTSARKAELAEMARNPDGAAARLSGLSPR